MSDKQNLLTIKALSVTINGRVILKDIDLSIPERVVVAIIGPSGCGKSVLLKSIVGLLKQELRSPRALHYEGRIDYEGSNLLELPERQLESVRRNIAYINQHPVAFPMSLYDNVAFGLKYWEPSLSRSEINDRVHMALVDVGLWGAVSHRMRENATDLSAGQLQKLCLARAMVLKPQILLLDEPCAYIDPRSAVMIEESIVELKKKCTLVVVTHNMQQAARISDSSSFINVDSRGELGVLVESGPTEKIFTAPQEKSTEDYITGRFG